MPHVVTTRSHAARVHEDSRGALWDKFAAIIRQAQKQQNPSLGPELDGLMRRGTPSLPTLLSLC